ncbi:MgtC/SapB family protein [Mycobacterium sp. WMMD1722]|uniref:MgtC/SapB family protein n=1 Tax=Mycobacterium sp. WMMD1722 TaxID=3404117 RepID=UPI003BF5251A
MLAVELITRVGLATLLGVIIGVERQWRARMAGLQTMALVSMGSALFFILGAFSFPGTDPTRVAAQIVSGIGFLGAGVILKHGLSVVGLNTAATLWATAAVGALAGAWMWREAIAGAAIVVFGNLFLQPLARRMDIRSGRNAAEEASTFTIEVACPRDSGEQVRALVGSALGSAELTVTAISSAVRAADDETVVRADVSTGAGGEAGVEAAVSELATDPRVRAARWSAT